MTDFFFTIIKHIAIIIILILSGLYLKRKGVIKESDRQLFGRMITDYILPAFIICGLLSQRPNIESLKIVPLMLLILFVSMISAWSLGKMLHLSPKKMGAFMLVLTVPSTSTLGYALISQIYTKNSAVLSDAIIVSEIGVGIPLFTIGVMIAMYYGEEHTQFLHNIRGYFSSPIFFAVIIGLLSYFLPDDVYSLMTSVLLPIFTPISHALTVVVILSVALMLRPVQIRFIVLPALCAVLVKLVVEPFVALFFAHGAGLVDMQTTILVLSSSLPSGAVTAILAEKYGCDGGLASTLLVVTYCVAPLTIPIVALFIGF
jgi:predicted permease